MKTHPFSILLKRIVFSFFLPAILSCSSNSENQETHNTGSSETYTPSQSTEVVDDSITQFLLTSASTDFAAHQPPTAIEFRNVQVGYVRSSENEKIFLLCGEFLSAEKKLKGEWEPFATLKTSGYEHYLGDQSLSFCQKATMVSTDKTSLSVELKNKLIEVRKRQ